MRHFHQHRTFERIVEATATDERVRAHLGVLFEYEIKRAQLHSKIAAIHWRTNTESFAELFCSTTCLRDLFLAGKHHELSQTRWCRECGKATNMHLRHERQAQWMVLEREQAGQFLVG